MIADKLDAVTPYPRNAIGVSHSAGVADKSGMRKNAFGNRRSSNCVPQKKEVEYVGKKGNFTELDSSAPWRRQGQSALRRFVQIGLIFNQLANQRYRGAVAAADADATQRSGGGMDAQPQSTLQCLVP